MSTQKGNAEKRSANEVSQAHRGYAGVCDAVSFQVVIKFTNQGFDDCGNGQLAFSPGHAREMARALRDYIQGKKA